MTIFDLKKKVRDVLGAPDDMTIDGCRIVHVFTDDELAEYRKRKTFELNRQAEAADCVVIRDALIHNSDKDAFDKSFILDCSMAFLDAGVALRKARNSLLDYMLKFDNKPIMDDEDRSYQLRPYKESGVYCIVDTTDRYDVEEDPLSEFEKAMTEYVNIQIKKERAGDE